MTLRIVSNENVVYEVSVVSVSMSETMKGEKVLEYVPDSPDASFKQIPFCFLLAWKVFE